MAEALSRSSFYPVRHRHYKFINKNFLTKTPPNMNYLQATQEITVAIPEICDDLKKTTIQNSYHIIEFLTDKIKTMIQENNTSCLFKCLRKMDDLYKDGDKMVKNAIENSFIYSLDSCTAFCTKEYRDLIFNRLSPELQHVYARQIYSHSI